MKCSHCDYPYATFTNCPNCGNAGWSFCFITEAACVHGGLPDDCHELTVLRNFRDSYMLHDHDRRKSVDLYYQIAPRIVATINASGRSAEVYSRLMDQFLEPSVEAIEQGRPEDAFRIYTKMMRELTDRYVFNGNVS